jgi:hypothetical protein
VAFLAV